MREKAIFSVTSAQIGVIIGAGALTGIISQPVWGIITILAILFFGVSGMVGSLLGGLVLEKYGASALFLLMAGLSFASLVFSLLLGKNEKNRSM